MADNHIRFQIGAMFSGEGFKKAQAAVNEVNGDVKRATGSATQLAGAFSQMDQAASKNMQAMTSLVQAIATFNVTTIATSVMMIGINRYFGEMKDKADAAKKAADELHASMEKAFASALTDRMTSVNAEVRKISDDFERITKQANQFAAALEGVRSAEASGGIINLQVEKLNALLAAHSDEERANIEASYNLKIAVQKSADTEIAWQAKVEAAHQAVVDSENRKATVEKQLAAVEEERMSLEKTMVVAKESGDSHYIEIQKKVNALKEQEATLSQKILDTESQTDVLRVEENKVKQEAINAQGQATIEIRNAELAEVKLTEAKHNRTEKEEAAKDAADEKAAAELLDTKSIKTAAEIQDDANKAARELAAAERDYAAKLKAYQSGDLIRELAQGLVGNGGLKGGKNLFPVDVQKSVQFAVADTKVDDAIRNGAVNTVKDADRLQRQAMREARDMISKNQGQQLREAQRYKRLQEMNPKALASSDKAFMAKYEKIQAAAEKRKQDLAKAKEAVEKSKDKTEETNKLLKETNSMLKKLGLK